jgi:lambda repressor-like predicted transcriptional regulator
MINFKDALAYLLKKGVTARELSNFSGLSAGSLFAVLDGTTQNPRRKTKDVVIAYAKKLMENNKESYADGVIFSSDEDILDKKDANYIKKLAVAVRANEEALLQEQSFKDLIYIQALKMALLAKDGETISIKKLMELR